MIIFKNNNFLLHQKITLANRENSISAAIVVGNQSVGRWKQINMHSSSHRHHHLDEEPMDLLLLFELNWPTFPLAVARIAMLVARCWCFFQLGWWWREISHWTANVALFCRLPVVTGYWWLGPACVHRVFLSDEKGRERQRLNIGKLCKAMLQRRDLVVGGNGVETDAGGTHEPQATGSIGRQAEQQA